MSLLKHHLNVYQCLGGTFAQTDRELGCYKLCFGCLFCPIMAVDSMGF